jgi:uncharacterized delta-60 repeat protein
MTSMTARRKHAPIGESALRRRSADFRAAPEGAMQRRTLVMFHRRTTATLAIALATLAACGSAVAQDGTWDASWAPRNSDQKGIPGLIEDTWALGGTGTYAGDMNATAIAMQADGKQLVAGFGWNTYNGTDQNACVVRRYYADGSIDTAFGNMSGAVVTNWRTTNSDPKLDCYVKSVVVQPDGKIVYAGQLVYPSGGLTPTIMVARLNPDGTSDGSFGDDGFVYDFGYDANALLVAGNGDILVAGTNIPQGFSDTDFYLATLSVGGQLKNEAWLNFGVAGGDGNETGNAAVLESWSSGTIGNFHSHDEVYVAGVVDNPGYASGLAHHSCGVVAFRRTDGGNFSIDTGFGNGGLVNTDFAVGVSDTDTICRTAARRPSTGALFGPSGVVVGGERYFVPTSGTGLASYYALADIDSAGAVTRHDAFAYFADLNEDGAFNSIFGMTWDNVGKLVAVGYAGIGANGNSQHAPSDGVVRRFNTDYSVDGSFAADHSGTLFASLDTSGASGVVQAQREWANAVAFDPIHGRVVFAGERSVLISLVPNLYAWFLGAVHDGNVAPPDRIFANGFD